RAKGRLTVMDREGDERLFSEKQSGWREASRWEGGKKRTPTYPPRKVTLSDHVERGNGNAWLRLSRDAPRTSARRSSRNRDARPQLRRRVQARELRTPAASCSVLRASRGWGIARRASGR